MSGGEDDLNTVMSRVAAMMRRAKAESGRGFSAVSWTQRRIAEAAAKSECRRLDDAEARAKETPDHG